MEIYRSNQRWEFCRESRSSYMLAIYTCIYTHTHTRHIHVLTYVCICTYSCRSTTERGMKSQIHGFTFQPGCLYLWFHPPRRFSYILRIIYRFSRYSYTLELFPETSVYCVRWIMWAFAFLRSYLYYLPSLDLSEYIRTENFLFK